MRSRYAALATFTVVTLVAVAKPLAPPATGWLFYYVNDQYIFPPTATQCEPFYIYHDAAQRRFLDFYDVAATGALFTMVIPGGIGYVEWTCNLPAGVAFRLPPGQPGYVVQPGPSSACLGNLTTVYPSLDYNTTAFASYTRTASLPATLDATASLTTASFPTGAFSTITLNPNLAVTRTTSPPPSSPTVSSSSAPSHKSRSSSIVGGVVGALVLVLLIIVLVFVLRRKCRCPALARASSPFDPQPAAVSGLETGELEPTYLPSPFPFSGTKFPIGTPQTPPDPCGNAGGLSSGSDAMAAPATGSPAADAVPEAGQRPSHLTIARVEAAPLLASQRPREPMDSGPRAPLPTPAAALSSRTPPTADPQPPHAHPLEAADVAPETALRDAAPPFRPPPLSEPQEGPLDLAAVLGVIERARLSPQERRVVASVNSLLSVSPDLQTMMSSPPPYSE